MIIVFFGSGDFTFPIVKRIKEEFTLAGVVVTKPKPRGRGLKIRLPEVARWAEEQGIEVFTPDDPNDKEFINTLTKLKPDIFVLSSYGHILKNELLEVPRLGGINIHPSLLPKYRGAAPIQRALMAGEKKTGITVIFMDEKIDHGDIIFQRELSIKEDEDYGSLSSRLSYLAADIIGDVLRAVEAGDYKRVKQNPQEKSYAGKIKKEETMIDWHNSTEKIYNLVRALSPQPGARTVFRNKELKIMAVEPTDRKLSPGICHIENKSIYVGTGDGSVILKKVKPENRRMISGLDFINGFRIKEGEVIG